MEKDCEVFDQLNNPSQHSHSDRSIQSLINTLATVSSLCLAILLLLSDCLLSVTDCAAGRADALGKLGVSYGIGMVIGPFVGGLITKNYGEQSAAFFAAGFSVLSIFIALLFIPRNTKSLSKDEKSAENLQTSEKHC